ncbi:MAG: glycosyltransferase family 2 protein [Prevotella sp.]
MYDTTEFMNREKICVIVPTYNNSGTIADVLSRIYKITQNIIVVNDGSNDNTKYILQNIGFSLTIVEYEQNRGKGYALKCGFRKALSMGFRNAITIDSDGQHFPEDIPILVDAYREHPGALVIGVRNLSQDNMPGSNTFANKFSNFWFCVQTLVKLKDTQSGYRLYPVSRIKTSWIFTSRYEAELELLVFAAWHGIDIRQVDVRVYYPSPEERVTHFRPGYDFFRISILNTMLCMGALFYYLPKLIYKSLKC